MLVSGLSERQCLANLRVLDRPGIAHAILLRDRQLVRCRALLRVVALVRDRESAQQFAKVFLSDSAEYFRHGYVDCLALVIVLDLVLVRVRHAFSDLNDCPRALLSVRCHFIVVMFVSGLGECQRLADFRIIDRPRVHETAFVCLRIRDLQAPGFRARFVITLVVDHIISCDLRKVRCCDPAECLDYDHFVHFALVIVLDLVLVRILYRFICEFDYFPVPCFIFRFNFVVHVFVSRLRERQRLADLRVFDRPCVHEPALVRFRVRNLQFTSCRAFRVFVARVIDHIISRDLRKVRCSDPAECLHYDQICCLALIRIRKLYNVFCFIIITDDKRICIRIIVRQFLGSFARSRCSTCPGIILYIIATFGKCNAGIYRNTGNRPNIRIILCACAFCCIHSEFRIIIIVRDLKAFRQLINAREALRHRYVKGHPVNERDQHGSSITVIAELCSRAIAFTTNTCYLQFAVYFPHSDCQCHRCRSLDPFGRPCLFNSIGISAGFITAESSIGIRVVLIAVIYTNFLCSTAHINGSPVECSQLEVIIFAFFPLVAFNNFFHLDFGISAIKLS